MSETPLNKSSVYTRTGDAGSTSLVGGERADKDSIRIDAYGDIDELNSSLGWVRAGEKCPEEISGQLAEIQNLMFEIGGYLATPAHRSAEMLPHQLKQEIERLEGWIDALDESTPPINSFIIPGGNESAARCHLARTVCRRAERHICLLAKEEPIDSDIVAYINRLSDYLFVAARYLNFIDGVADIPWRHKS